MIKHFSIHKFVALCQPTQVDHLVTTVVITIAVGIANSENLVQNIPGAPYRARCSGCDWTEDGNIPQKVINGNDWKRRHNRASSHYEFRHPIIEPVLEFKTPSKETTEHGK